MTNNNSYKFNEIFDANYANNYHLSSNNVFAHSVGTCCVVTVAKAVPWLRRLVAGLPQWRPGFHPGSVHVGFVVDKVALGQVFPPSTSVFPCQFRSTGASLLGKMKKTNHLHHRVAQ
jgi:hypothetical protein